MNGLATRRAFLVGLILAALVADKPVFGRENN